MRVITNESYYKWEFSGTYEYEAILATRPYMIYELDKAIELGLQWQFCWKDIYSNNYLKIQDDKLFNGDCVDDFFLFDKALDKEFQIAMYLELQQYGITEKEFDYLAELGNQFDNKGTIFETGNYQIRGNTHLEGNQNALVLGFFGVRSVSRKAIFITSYDLSYKHDYGPCIVKVPNVILPSQCFDCRAVPGISHENLKPDFWPK